MAVSTAFDDIEIAALAALPPEVRDGLPYGVVGLDPAGLVVVYSAAEARMAGLDRESVVGMPFFDAVAQCMNNFMVAQRFEDETELDETLPYVLTLRMRPTRVRLRLLATSTEPLNYILIER
ncbi:PAS domain-containing protein [Sphingomonas sp. PAMC 26621]|uniref:PAS domain-containing protein n=1 Tax=Sphingomonas sp. PAMC 26621 TaxID=1112213 RepID=UPI000288390B|nr:PAS domain-containing protein [Sphingomonas sp. PAMC 26621]